MRPVFRLVALILLVCLIGSGRAEAGIWDWLEELNGPGPSSTRGNFMTNFSCRRINKSETSMTEIVKEKEGSRLLTPADFATPSPEFLANLRAPVSQPQTISAPPITQITPATATTPRVETTFSTTIKSLRLADGTTQKTTTLKTNSVAFLPKFTVPVQTYDSAKCMFFDLRVLHADDDLRFYPVDIVFGEIGTSIWIHNLVEIGAGAGAIWFTSRNPETDHRYTGIRPTVTFPRIAFKPLLALPKVDDSRWGFFQVYFKESIIVGTVDQDDFASKPGNIFSRNSQRVTSMGFIIDLPSLFGRTM
jgi:hypothetical protein